MTRIILTFAFSLFVSPAWAAVPAHDATTTSTQGGVQNPSYSHTPTGGACPNSVAIIGVVFQDSTPGTLTTVTYGGSGATALHNAFDPGGGNNIFVSLWIYKNSGIGAATVQANFSESMNSVTIHTSTYCNVAQGTSTGTVYTSDQGLLVPSVTVVDSAAGELAVDVVGSPDRTITVDGSQTERSNFQAAGNHEHLSSEKAGAASVVLSWSCNSNCRSGSIGTSLKPSNDQRIRGHLIFQ